MKNEKWKTLAKQVLNQNDDKHLIHEPTDPEIQSYGWLLPDMCQATYYCRYWTFLWLEWLKEDRNERDRNAAIEAGHINEQCQPLFHKKWNQEIARAEGLIDENGNLILETKPITAWCGTRRPSAVIVN